MKPPQGKLTPAQHEIMEFIWKAERGATVAEIWEAVARSRSVTRTTVLNFIGRLHRRGWLKRAKVDNTFRYVATVSPDRVSDLAASGMVDDFFGGSASKLVMSLLRSKRLRPEEIERLRGLIDSLPTGSKEERKK
jgi:BlaI family transcriptional regulator, penicillinase repressor